MNEDRRIRVLIVDDHPVVRSGLRVIEALDPTLCVVGEAATLAEGLAALAQSPPDVVLLDLRLPDGDGLEICREAKRRIPPAQVICLTSFSDPGLVLSAATAGADAYLLKHNDAERILTAIRAVLEGDQVFDVPPEACGVEASPREAVGLLAPGERRVLEQVARGLTDKEVAQALELSPKTVRNTLDRVFAKLGVRSRTQAALALLSQTGLPLADRLERSAAPPTDP